VDQARDLGADGGVVVDVDRDVVGEGAHTTQVGMGAYCSVRPVDTESKLSHHHQIISERSSLLT
jgi:hypothetical protein